MNVEFAMKVTFMTIGNNEGGICDVGDFYDIGNNEGGNLRCRCLMT